MPKKTDFTQKVQKLVRINNSPNSLEEFLNDDHSTQSIPEVLIPQSPNLQEDKLFKREEFKFPIEVCERLRTTSYALKRTKKEIVQTALIEYLNKLNF